MDVGWDPAVCGVDVAGTRRRDAHQVGERPEQDVVAGSGPGFFEEDLVVVVEVGVEEEVDGLPALAGSHAEGGQDPVEVVAAVDVAGVAHLLVVPGVAGRVEGVVAADRVLDDLDEGFAVDGEVLGEQARHWVARPHEAAGHGGIEGLFDSGIEACGREDLEVGAFAALDVDDLDELAGGHLVGDCGGLRDPDVLVLVGQRVGEDLPAGFGQPGPVDPDDHVGGQILLVGKHSGAGHTAHADDGGLCREAGGLAGGGVGCEEVDCLGSA